MLGFGGVTVVLLATLGGAWGCRIGTKRLYRRSIFDDGDKVAAGAAVPIALMTRRATGL